MSAQGLVSTIPGQAVNLQGLINSSQNAQGALAAAQAGNQIAAMNAQQMMILQQMIAQSNQAQMSYLAQQQQEKAMAKAAADQWFGERPPVTEGGQGPGIIH